MKILALDLGTHTGWAYYNEGQVKSGRWDFSKGLSEHPEKRWIGFRESLDQFVGVEKVYYEKVLHHTGTLAAHVYGGFEAVLQSWCNDNGATFHGVGVTSLKKHATGRGNATKEEMVQVANMEMTKRKWIHRPMSAAVDHDQADALWLLDVGVNEMSKDTMGDETGNDLMDEEKEN